MNRFSTIAGWLCQPWRTPDFALFGSHSSGLETEHHWFFFFIPYSFRNFLTKFGNFSQQAEPIGNQFNRLSTIAGWLYQLWGTPDLALFGSHFSGLGIGNHCFCLIPYSFRNFMKKFGNFSQPTELVGNRFNQFSTTARWLCQLWGTPDLALFGSHSVGLGIEHHCFCVILYSFRNFLK